MKEKGEVSDMNIKVEGNIWKTNRIAFDHNTDFSDAISVHI